MSAPYSSPLPLLPSLLVLSQRHVLFSHLFILITHEVQLVLGLGLGESPDICAAPLSTRLPPLQDQLLCGFLRGFFP